MLPTQWCLHAAAFYDRLARRICLCRAALSGSHCDVINQTMHIRHIGHWSTVALSSLMLQITANVPMSDIIIDLTLFSKHVLERF